MQSKAKDVTTYIEEPLTEMKYVGPTYKRNGEAEVGFASQKNFIGLYILRTDVMNAHRTS